MNALCSDFYIGQYNALARRFNGLSNALRELAPQVGDMERRVQAQDQELRAKDARIAELEEQLRRSQAPRLPQATGVGSRHLDRSSDQASKKDGGGKSSSVRSRP